MRWIAASLVAFGVLAALPAHAQEWTRFRGPNGTGISATKGIPVQFTESELNWKAQLPGTGHSSPVIWGDKIFLTSAENDTGKQHLLCLSTVNGKVLWDVTRPFDKYTTHKFNTSASATAAVDKDLVYVPWYSNTQVFLTAFTHTGKEVWKYELGPWHGQHGGACSPILFEDLVIIRHDNDKMGPESFIVAVDRKTGQQRWKTPQVSKDASYSTPVIYQPKGGAAQLVYNGNAHGIISLDPKTGKLNWESPGAFLQRCVSGPVLLGDTIVGTAGNGGGARQGVAIKPGANGKPGEVAIQFDRRVVPYVPTPIAYRDWIFMWRDDGIVSCLKAENGEIVWSERVNGNFFSSPVCIDGKLYGVSASGEVVVVDASDQFKVLGRSLLGGTCHSSPAVAGGALYIRTENQLYSVGGKKLARNNQ